jgi:hypothetical protein
MADNRLLKLIISLICALVAGISALALAGWIFDIQLLKGVRADWATMRVSTALGLACCAAALFTARDPLTRLRRVRNWCSGQALTRPAPRSRRMR